MACERYFIVERNQRWVVLHQGAQSPQYVRLEEAVQAAVEQAEDNRVAQPQGKYVIYQEFRNQLAEVLKSDDFFPNEHHEFRTLQ